jgi:hypothetical protein
LQRLRERRERKGRRTAHRRWLVCEAAIEVSNSITAAVYTKKVKKEKKKEGKRQGK